MADTTPARTSLPAASPAAAGGVSRAVLEAACEHTANAIIITDRDGTIVWVNPAFSAISGYTREEAVGQTPRLLKSGLHPNSFYQDLWRTALAGETWRGAVINRRKDGQHYHGELVVTPVRDGGNAIGFFVAVMNDVTARREIEEALRQSRALHLSLMEQMPAGIYRKDAAGHYVYVNSAFAKFAGLAPAEHFGRSAGDLEVYLRGRSKVQPGAAELAPLFAQGDAHHAQIMETGARLDFEHEAVGPGARRWLRVLKTPAYDSAGRVIGSQGVVFDITAQKEAQRELREQREQWERLVTMSPNALFVVRDECFVMTNPAADAMFGAQPGGLRGRCVFDFIPEELHPLIRGRVREAEATGTPRPRLEQRIRRADGTSLAIEASSVFMHYGGLPALLVEARDITDRQRLQDTIRASEERLRLITETIHEVFWMADADLKESVYVSPGYERIWGRSPETLRANPRAFIECIHEADHDRVVAGLERRRGNAFAHEYRVIQPSGDMRWVWDQGFPIRDAAGVVTHYVGVAQDITERKRAEESLREAKERYQAIFQHATEGIFQTTPDGVFLAANPAMAAILRFASAEELMTQRRDIAHQGYVRPERREEFKRLIQVQGFVTGFEYEVFRKDGSRAWVSENARAVRTADGVIQYYEGSMVDITERVRAEARTRLQYAVTEVLAENPAIEQTRPRVLETIVRGLQWDVGEMWIVDRHAQVLRCADLWHPPGSDYTHLARANCDLVFARGAALPGRVWASGRAEWVADITVDPDFQRAAVAVPLGLHTWIGFPIKLRNEILGVVGFFSAEPHASDPEMIAMLSAFGSQLGQFMERQQLAAQFRHAQKMEAIGTLAGGIAHDFNNIIAAMAGFTELAKLELGSHPVREHLDAVLVGSKRAAALVRQLLAFSRHQESERRPIQLHHVVDEALRLLRATIPASIEFDFGFEKDVPMALADPTQVHQVVMNLVTNAWHAMREQTGRLTVRIEPCRIEHELLGQPAGLRPGSYARISVADTGRGIDPRTLERIFEPFFTTKAPGEGTGLGLAVVHGIMQSHKGAVTVYSQPGQGTIFRLYFPGADAGEAPEPPQDLARLARGNGERVLYVDDEEPLVRMGTHVLQRLGYRVQATTRAQAALDLLRTDPSAFDCVVTDLAMPGMNGTQLAQEIRALRPDLPVLLITGYNGDLTPERTNAMGIRELLSKPISAYALGAAVARNLAVTPPNHS